MTNYSLPGKIGKGRQTIKRLRNSSSKFWVTRGNKAALSLFQDMATRVPAYKKFLAKNKINPDKINTIEDIQHVPLINKKNYLLENKYEDMVWDGNFSNKQWDLATTSGTSGTPFYFPRSDTQNDQYAFTAELYLLDNFNIDSKTTLYINAFPMGAWIGGVFTLEALKIIQNNSDYKLTVINPGINKKEIVDAIKRFSGVFDQIIIGAYAPFLRDVIDDGLALGIKWNKNNFGFVFSAEGFSESFRDFVNEHTNKKNVYTSTLNHYGTVDLGTMSYETPFSILLRRFALKNAIAKKIILGESQILPTVTQFFPEQFFFEEIEDKLVCSANSGLPLFRYDLKDRGHVLSYKNVEKVLPEIVKHGPTQDAIDVIKTHWRLPIVEVFERDDLSVSFYAFQIYPEYIRKSLLDKSISNKLTGKFAMEVVHDSRHNPILKVNIEKRPRIKEDAKLNRKIIKVLVEYLRKLSSEYRETHDQKGTMAAPRIVLWDYESRKYFTPGRKQRWSIK